MVTPFLPAWIVGLISPLLNLVSERIPSALRPAVIFGICAAVIAGTVWITPLMVTELPAQVWALFCVVTGAYTLAKPVEGKGSPASWATAVVIGGSLMALPLLAQIPTGAEPTTSGSAFVASIIGAIVARILRRWFK